MSEAADIPIPVDTPPNARKPDLEIDMDDEELVTTPLIVRASGAALMGSPTQFDNVG